MTCSYTRTRTGAPVPWARRAVLISFPLPVCIRAVKSMISIAMDRGGDSAKLIDEIVGFAAKARKETLDQSWKECKEATQQAWRLFQGDK